MSADLAAFVTARLGEDEAAAKAAQLRHAGPWSHADNPDSPLPVAASLYDSRDESVGVIRGSYLAAHIARHDPARVLREVAAKRAILAAWQESLTIQDGYREVGYEEGRREAQERDVRHLAAAWGDHPDYDPEWRCS